MKKINKVMWGLALLALGGVIGLNRLGVVDVDLFFDGWWALFIIVPSLISLVTGRKKFGAFIWLAIGVLLLLLSNGMVNAKMTGELILPALLLLFGGKLIFDAIFGSRKFVDNPEVAEDGNCTVSFGEKKLNYSGKKVGNLELDAAFGSIQLNLKEANIPKDININISCVFSGIKITLPAGVALIDKTTGIFGGVDADEVESDKNAKAKVYLTGSCVFGGVEVR